MKTKSGKQNLKRKKIYFKFESPHSKRVSLVGNFNNWDETRHPMANDGNGVWSKTVLLSEGAHRYKFLADGQWVPDPNNERREANEFGTQNNIIDVG